MNYYCKINWPAGPIYYSKFGVYFSNTQAIPLLKTVQSISRVLIQYESFENSSASIELSDHTGHFSEKLNNDDDKYCVGIEVTIFQKGDAIFTGYISEIPEIKSRICYITIDLFTILKKKINKQITKSEFIGVPAQNEGKWGNIVFGNGNTNSGRMFTAYRVGENKFLAAWNSLSNIDKAYKGDINITSNITISIDSVTGYTYIICTSTELEISFSCLGPESGSGELIENPAKMLESLLSQFTSIIISNTDAIATSYEGRAVYNGNCLYIYDDKTIKEFLSEFCFNYDASLIFTRDGHFLLNLVNWGNIISKANPHPTEYLKFESWKESTNLINKVQRKYQYIPLDGKFNREPQDLNASTQYNEILKELQHRFLQNNQTSWDVSARYVYLFQQQEELVSFEISRELVKEYDINIGDILSVSHRKTNFIEKLVYIRRENHEGPIKFEGIDVSSLTGAEFYLYSGTDERNPYLSESEGPLLF